jgi:hypothetical protein
MNNFGTIKSKLEKASVDLFGKKEFSTFMSNFKKGILENKDMSEIYFIYDDLSSKKGISKDIATDYVNESIEYCQILIEGNKSKINKIDKWISNFVSEVENKYNSIDTLIYKNSIKNLETVLESKKNIISTIVSEETKKQVKESIQLPITTMVKVAEDNIKGQLESLSESERKEIISIVSLSKKELDKEFNELKESVISNLKTSLNESKEDDMKSVIDKTISKISESKSNPYDLYKLRKLNSGL